MSESNINKAAFHIIGTMAVWNISHMYYNLTNIKNDHYITDNSRYTVYFGLGCIAMFSSVNLMYKYK
jgi:hypothetical protein